MLLLLHRANNNTTPSILRATSSTISSRIVHKLSSFRMSTNPTNDDSLLNVFSEENRLRALHFIKNKQTGLKFQHSFIKRAAVLIPLCFDVNGQPSILYTLRSLKLKSHRGEISFPGGASDPADNGNDVTTALRETEEELGLTRDQIEVWGALSPLPTVTNLMGVTPVLGFIKVNPLDCSTLAINRNEVEVAFTVSLQHLCDPVNWGHTQFRRGFGMPIYKNLKVSHPVDDPNHGLMVQISESSSSDDEKQYGNVEPVERREIKLWGLTAILTHLALEGLLPTLYKRQVPMLASSPSSSPSSSPDSGTVRHGHGQHSHSHSHNDNGPKGKL